jgi:hypothetical protein
MITVLAPFLYTASSKVERASSSPGVRQLQYQGFVWCFLLATALTLWGVLGEILTVGFLLGEIQAGGALPYTAIVPFALLLFVSVILLCTYAWRGICAVVSYQTIRSSHKSDRALAIPVDLGEGLNLGEVHKGSPDTTLPPPLPPWSVL